MVGDLECCKERKLKTLLFKNITLHNERQLYINIIDDRHRTPWSSQTIVIIAQPVGSDVPRRY